VLAFKVENSNTFSKKLELIIRPKIDPRTGLKCPLNFRCPVSTIPCEVFSDSVAVIATFTKLNPEIDSWGEFEWDFQVMEKNQVTQQFGNDQGFQGNDNDDNFFYVNSNEAGTGADTSVKACPTCTFHNSPGATQCEMCGQSI